MQSAKKDARKDYGRDEWIVYTALMDSISSIYNMYKSSVALYIFSISPHCPLMALTGCDTEQQWIDGLMNFVDDARPSWHTARRTKLYLWQRDLR